MLRAALRPGAHRLDHGGRAGDDVAAGEDAGHRGREVVVGLDVAALVELQLRGLADDRIGVGADREHHQVGLELELAARRPAPGRRRPESSGSPSSMRMQRMPRTLPLPSSRISTGLVSQWNSMPSSSAWCTSSARAGASVLRAAVDAVDLLGAEPQADAHRVHRGVAGADHRDALAERQRRVEVREVLRAHQVAARQQLVGREHAVERIARECRASSGSRRRCR